MAWKKIEGNVGTDMWDFDTNKELEGEFVRKEEKVGPNNSNVYYFMVGNEEIGVWGNTVLDSRLAQIQDGQRVKIVYLGLTKSKRGTSYKNFDVFVEEKDLPF